jgi:hypothetical protein
MSKEAIEKIAEWRWRENHPDDWVGNHPDEAWGNLSKSMKRMLFADARRLLRFAESLGYVQLAENQTLPELPKFYNDAEGEAGKLGYKHAQQDMITPKDGCVWRKLKEE